MKYLWIALAAGGLVAGCGVENKTENPQQVAESAAPSVMLNTQVSAPVAKKVPHEMTAHGVTRNTIGCVMTPAPTKRYCPI